jgi:hypothetical protein
MKIGILLGVAALTSHTLAAPGHAQCRSPGPVTAGRHVITYRFALHSVADTTRLGVTVEFAGSGNGTDTVRIPAQWAGQHLHAMRNLRALDEGSSGSEIVVPACVRVTLDSVPQLHIVDGYVPRPGACGLAIE